MFRTLNTLPGVASADDFGSRLAVRGGTPDQNLTVMDGVEIHNPYRLFGITSAFNPETVENFNLTAGGFGVAYGDRLSSLLVVDNRPGRRDFQGAAALSITDGNVVLEGPTPVWDNGAWLFSARRTYYDLLLNTFGDHRNFPSFTDLQLQAGWEFGPGHRLTLMGQYPQRSTHHEQPHERRGRLRVWVRRLPRPRELYLAGETGWLSYASDRANRESYGQRYAGEYDRRHAFNDVDRYELTRRWDVAATDNHCQLAIPHTPPIWLRVSSREATEESSCRRPTWTGTSIYTLDYGGVENLNAGRLPHYARVQSQIDVRTDRCHRAVVVLHRGHQSSGP